MSFLKKLGQVILNVTGIVTGFGPLIAALIPGNKDDKIIQIVSADLTQIANIIQQVEVFGQALGLPGADKLKGSAPAVAQIILQSSLMINKKINNPVLFKQGCTKIADGMADILNSIPDNNVQIEDKKA